MATLNEQYPAHYRVKQVHNMLRLARQQNNANVNQFANLFRWLGDRVKPELDKYLVNEDALTSCKICKSDPANRWLRWLRWLLPYNTL
jgi:hypothetical protein